MKIGFIGLGNMGNGMAKNIIAKDFEVVGFDIENDKLVELEGSGLEVATSIADIAKGCEIILLCLPNPDISRRVIDQLLAENNTIITIIETSTLTPEIVNEFADMI